MCGKLYSLTMIIISSDGVDDTFPVGYKSGKYALILAKKMIDSN